MAELVTTTPKLIYISSEIGDSVRFKLLKSTLTVLLLQVINCFSNYGANWCYKPAIIYWKNIVFQQCSITFRLYKGMWCLLDLSSSNDADSLI